MDSPEIARERDELRRALGRADDRNSRLRVFERLVRIDTRLQSFDPLTDDLEIVNLDIEGRQETWTDVLRLQDDGVQPAEFAAITAPVVMLHGDTDPHPGTMIRDSLSPFITGLQYIEFPRCGHIPWIERQARDAFLRELRSQLRDALGK